MTHLEFLDSYFSMPDPLEFHPFVCLGKKHINKKKGDQCTHAIAQPS